MYSRELLENPLWKQFYQSLLTRLEAARLTLEDLTLNERELNIQRGAVAELRQIIYLAKTLTQDTNLKESDSGHRASEETD